MAEQKHTQDPLDMEEALSTSEAFLIKNKGKILGTIAAVVIIIAGFMGYKHFISEPNEIKTNSVEQLPAIWPMLMQVSALHSWENMKMQ